VKNINWIEAYSTDPITDETYYVRVDSSLYKNEEIALYEAYKRATYLADRGLRIMAENLMNSDHKATNKQYRDNYDSIKWSKGDDKTNNGQIKDKK